MGTDILEEPVASIFRVDNTSSCPEYHNCNIYCWPSVCFVSCFIVPISNDIRCTTEIQDLNLYQMKGKVLSCVGQAWAFENKNLPWLSAAALGFTGHIIRVKNGPLCRTEACDVIQSGVCT